MYYQLQQRFKFQMVIKLYISMVICYKFTPFLIYDTKVESMARLTKNGG